MKRWLWLVILLIGFMSGATVYYRNQSRGKSHLAQLSARIRSLKIHIDINRYREWHPDLSNEKAERLQKLMPFTIPLNKQMAESIARGMSSTKEVSRSERWRTDMVTVSISIDGENDLKLRACPILGLTQNTCKILDFTQNKEEDFFTSEESKKRFVFVGLGEEIAKHWQRLLASIE